MTLNLTLSLIVIFVLIGCSAFFAGSETALTAVSKARMYHLANEGSLAAKNVNRLIGDRERLIGALLLGNTFVNILASSLATEVTLAEFPESGVAIAAGFGAEDGDGVVEAFDEIDRGGDRGLIHVGEAFDGGDDAGAGYVVLGLGIVEDFREGCGV